MGDREDGDDLYHDALVAARMHVTDLRNHRAFRPWLFRIIVNTFKRRVKRPWWKRRLSLTPEVFENMSTGDPAPAYAARRFLERAFRAISPEDQALVTLFEMEQWTIVELSQLSGRTPQAVRVRLHRARRKMRAALVSQNGSPVPDKPVSMISMEEPLCAVERPGKN